MRLRSIRTTKITLRCVALLALVLACDAQGDRSSKKDSASASSVLEIHLRDLGYQPVQEYEYRGNGIPRDLSILNDDYRKRLTFIDEKTLVVYQSHYQLQNQKEGSAQLRSMEAFFVNPQTGALIARKTWPTVKRRWLNERWDTQARIMAVGGGFLVHAADSLILYSTGLEQKGRLKLEDGPRWAVTIAPLGRTIHLQRIHDDNQAEGDWYDSDALAKLRSQPEMAGVSSASDQAVVDKLAHCVQLRAVGDTPRNLYCAEASHLGLPLFLTDSEVLSVYGSGFSVRSTDGKKLWGREAPDGTRIVSSHTRSLDGNRFALLLRGGRQTFFDEVKVSKGELAIVVYGRSARTLLFHLALERVTEPIAFELSPNGSMLAVLVGETVQLYAIPS